MSYCSSLHWSLTLEPRCVVHPVTDKSPEEKDGESRGQPVGGGELDGVVCYTHQEHAHSEQPHPVSLEQAAEQITRPIRSASQNVGH